MYAIDLMMNEHIQIRDMLEVMRAMAKQLKEGKDVTIVTNGETTAEVIEASEILAKQGIDVEIVHMPMVKPMDKTTSGIKSSGMDLATLSSESVRSL